jgi:hypothetical protein
LLHWWHGFLCGLVRGETRRAQTVNCDARIVLGENTRNEVQNTQTGINAQIWNQDLLPGPSPARPRRPKMLHLNISPLDKPRRGRREDQNSLRTATQTLSAASSFQAQKVSFRHPIRTTISAHTSIEPEIQKHSNFLELSCTFYGPIRAQPCSRQDELTQKVTHQTMFENLPH